MMAMPAAQTLSDGLPAVSDHDERREEFRHRRADIAGAENAECCPLLFGRIPARNIGDTDRKRAACNADEERSNQKLGIRVRLGQEIGRNGRGQHYQRVDEPATVLIGPDAERDPDQRSAQDGRADQKAELRSR